jgi:hypothetical protein
MCVSSAVRPSDRLTLPGRPRVPSHGEQDKSVFVKIDHRIDDAARSPKSPREASLGIPAVTCEERITVLRRR